MLGLGHKSGRVEIVLFLIFTIMILALNTPIVPRYWLRLTSIFKEKKHCTFMSNHGGVLF